FAPGSGHLAAVGEDGAVRTWDPRARAARAEWPAHAGRVMGAAFSPDGKRLATSGVDHKIRIWDVDRIEAPAAEAPPLAVLPLKATLTGHTGSVYTAAFAPDGATLA